MGGIATSAVAHLISNTSNFSNFSEEVRQEFIEDVQDLTSTELTGACVGEEIILDVDGTQTYCTKMTSDETCE